MFDFFKAMAVFGTALLLLLFLAPPTPCTARQMSTPPVFPEVSLALGEFSSPKRSLHQEGEISSLIQGGHIAQEDRFPYMTLFLDRLDSQACGGVLVHESWVATAAHCLDKSADVNGIPLGLNPLMIIGALDITDRQGTRMNVQEETGFAVLHPGWNGKLGNGHDIALVKLPTPSKLKPITLAAPGTTFIAGEQLIALGWGRQGPEEEGRSTRLKWGTLTFTTNDNCNADFFWNGIVKSNMMCTAPVNNADVCKGDSGGPLILPHIPGGKVEKGKPKSDVLVGLVSFGEFGRCESSDPIDVRKPALFTRISEFQPWIEKVIATGGQVEDQAEGGGERCVALEQLNEDLWNAAHQGKTNAVKEAVACGANIEHRDGSNNATSLIIAAGKDHISVVQYLLEKGANVNARDKSGDTALIDACFICENPYLVNTLIDAGAEVNIQDNFGRTALIEAAINGHLECVEILINAGAEIDIQDGHETSALMEASRECLPEVAEALIKAGASKKLKKKGTDTAKDLIDCDPGNNGATKKLKKILG